MRYLQIPDETVATLTGLRELIWPDDNNDCINCIFDLRELHHRELQGRFWMVPESHPNIALIILKLPTKVYWFDREHPTLIPKYMLTYL